MKYISWTKKRAVICTLSESWLEKFIMCFFGWLFGVWKFGFALGIVGSRKILVWNSEIENMVVGIK